MKQWNTLYFSNLPDLFVDIYVKNNDIILTFGIIGNLDFEINYSKSYLNLVDLEQAYDEYIKFWTFTYSNSKLEMQIDLNSSINIDQIYQIKCLVEAAISGRLHLPDKGVGYKLKNSLQDLNDTLNYYNEFLDKFQSSLLNEHFQKFYL
ncbi:hypothetical protein [Thorsellia anophelis]|uniref:Uncharacterized protein n=1 Tax=Thorsellia anophelis DSM 18579 TaxID=1123402 RepID=A0A1I0F9L0_9GAMM|nr:hypothetical protein [Thorsellia anophelis]SET54600.1 hypothetical protein SAMN02583745_02691 [Thorsellia anophelis DSM 18579]